MFTHASSTCEFEILLKHFYLLKVIEPNRLIYFMQSSIEVIEQEIWILDFKRHSYILLDVKAKTQGVRIQDNSIVKEYELSHAFGLLDNDNESIKKT